MASSARGHEPAEPTIGGQRSFNRRLAARLHGCDQSTRQAALHLHDIFASAFLGELAERASGPMVARLPERLELRTTAIVRGEVVPDPVGLPATAKRARALQSGIAVAQGHSRGVVEEICAGATLGDVLTAAACWPSVGQTTTEAREARQICPGVGCLTRPGDFAGEQVEQFGLWQQEHVAAEPELEERQHRGRMETAALQAAAAAVNWTMAGVAGAKGLAHAHSNRGS